MRSTCSGDQPQVRGIMGMGMGAHAGKYSGDGSLWWRSEGATEAEFVKDPIP